MSLKLWCEIGNHPMNPADSGARGLKIEAAGTVWHLTPVGPRVDVCRPCLLGAIAGSSEASKVVPIRKGVARVQ